MASFKTDESFLEKNAPKTQEKAKRSELTANQHIYTLSGKRRKTKEDKGRQRKTTERQFRTEFHYQIITCQTVKRD